MLRGGRAALADLGLDRRTVEAAADAIGATPGRWPRPGRRSSRRCRPRASTPAGSAATTYSVFTSQTGVSDRPHPAGQGADVRAGGRLAAAAARADRDEALRTPAEQPSPTDPRRSPTSPAGLASPPRIRRRLLSRCWATGWPRWRSASARCCAARRRLTLQAGATRTWKAKCGRGRGRAARPPLASTSTCWVKDRWLAADADAMAAVIPGGNGFPQHRHHRRPGQATWTRTTKCQTHRHHRCRCPVADDEGRPRPLGARFKPNTASSWACPWLSLSAPPYGRPPEQHPRCTLQCSLSTLRYLLMKLWWGDSEAHHRGFTADADATRLLGARSTRPASPAARWTRLTGSEWTTAPCRPWASSHPSRSERYSTPPSPSATDGLDPDPKLPRRGARRDLSLCSPKGFGRGRGADDGIDCESAREVDSVGGFPAGPGPSSSRERWKRHRPTRAIAEARARCPSRFTPGPSYLSGGPKLSACSPADCHCGQPAGAGAQRHGDGRVPARCKPRLLGGGDVIRDRSAAWACARRWRPAHRHSTTSVYLLGSGPIAPVRWTTTQQHGYVPARERGATLDRVAPSHAGCGRHAHPELAAALADSLAVGGARPKVLVARRQRACNTLA